MEKHINAIIIFVLFTIVASSILFTERSDGGSIEGSIAANTSGHGLILSKNLMNSEDPLFMFSSKEIHNGDVFFDAYNRFPVVPFLMIGLIISPFQESIINQIYIARQLMNIFFLLSTFMLFKLVYELVNCRYLAITISFLTISSYYIISYHNIIFNDVPALFGFIMILYAAAIAQKNKLHFYQILFYSLLPISLGWQPYAAIFAWLAIDLIEMVFQKKETLWSEAILFFKKPSFQIMIISIIWGVIILGAQLLNEWRIVGGSFIELPSIRSGLWKSGLVSAVGHTSLLWTYDWFSYLPGQFRIITVMLVPFWPIFQVEPGTNISIFIVLSLLVYIIIKYFKAQTQLNKLLLIMFISGFFWTIPMRHFVALHDFQSMFYIGFATGVFILILSKINFKAWKFLAVCIAISFCISISVSNYYKMPHRNNVTAELENISSYLKVNSKIYFDGDRKHLSGYSRYAVELYLFDCFFTELDEAEYVVSKNTEFDGERLTTNQTYNLYRIVTDH